MKKEIKKLTTPYYSSLDKASPWNIYPRPQLKRDSFISLNGYWDFAVSKNSTRPTTFDKKILVPFPAESFLSEVELPFDEKNILHYRRTFTLPDGFKKDRIILHFGAVDRYCEVYVNGRKAATHNDGYIPFSIDLTDAICDGENELYLTVSDDLSEIYPYGKQRKKRGGMWYTPTSGIWQTVWLESIPENHIRKLKITPTKTKVKIELDSDCKTGKIILADGGEYTFTDGAIEIAPENPIPWTPENPKIYDFRIETESDRVESYFALREIGIADINGIPRITLNGKPYLFNGLLDQGYFPDGIFLPATPEGYEADIKAAKALGFNMLRKHIKIEPLIFYSLCDRLGMAVFQDMVNNSDYSFFRDTALPTVGFKRRSDKRLHKNPKSRAAFEKTMADTADLLYNSPSVLYYTIFNEGWGQFTADDEYEKLKSLDSTRITDSTSGWFWQSRSDVDSLHVYFKKLKADAPQKRPLVISEFGGYSFRVEGHLFGEKNYGYRTYESKEAFEDAVLSLYRNEVLPLVKKGASAFVYTQISDVEDETNGFLTYDRLCIKIDPEKMKGIAEELYSAAEKI